MDTSKILLATPYIKEIIYDKSITPPQVDMDKFNNDEDSQHDVSFIIKILYDFLNKFYVIDTFKNHVERRVWIQAMDKQYNNNVSAFLRGNALRKNSFGNIVATDVLWNLLLNAAKPKVKELLEPKIKNIVVDRSFLDNYDTLTIDQKIKFAKDLKVKILDLLNILKYSS